MPEPEKEPEKSNSPAGLIHCVAEIDDRGRFRFPKDVWAQSDWLEDPGHATAILEEPGVIQLLSPINWDQSILPEINRFAATIATNPSAEEEIFKFMDAYKKIEVARRFTLPNEILLHLGIASTLPASVYIESTPKMIRIMSQEFRNARLSRFVRDK